MYLLLIYDLIEIDNPKHGGIRCDCWAQVIF